MIERAAKPDPVTLYERGASLNEVSLATGVPQSTLQYRLKKAGLTRSISSALKLANRPRGPAHNRLDLTGQHFSELIVIESAGVQQVGNSRTRKSLWLCRCSCGTEITVHGSSLTTGNTKSCGCYRRKQRAKQKVSGSRTYRIWQAMLNRCRHHKHPLWHRYGGRGISVCKRWHSYEKFFQDMGKVPNGMSIDRIDNDGDYAPQNCRWATRHEQSRNMTTNRWLELNGKRQILADWAKELGMDQSSLRERLEKMPLEEALTKPKAR